MSVENKISRGAILLTADQLALLIYADRRLHSDKNVPDPVNDAMSDYSNDACHGLYGAVLDALELCESLDDATLIEQYRYAQDEV